MATGVEFRAGSSQPNRSYLSSNTLLIQDASPYHEKCIPKETRERVKSAPPRTRNVRDYQICNHVAEEMIWEERVRKERTLQKQWEKNLGFLATFDQYGDVKEKKTVPSKPPSVYKIMSRPVTASKEYGSRLDTSQAKAMLQLQNQMMDKKIKKDSRLLCYD